MRNGANGVFDKQSPGKVGFVFPRMHMRKKKKDFSNGAVYGII